jgi:hypothetical protein
MHVIVHHYHEHADACTVLVAQLTRAAATMLASWGPEDEQLRYVVSAASCPPAFGHFSPSPHEMT